MFCLLPKATFVCDYDFIVGFHEGNVGQIALAGHCPRHGKPVSNVIIRMLLL